MDFSLKLISRLMNSLFRHMWIDAGGTEPSRPCAEGDYSAISDEDTEKSRHLSICNHREGGGKWME